MLLLLVFHLLLSCLFHAAVLEIFEVDISDNLQERGKKESCPCAMQENRPGFASGSQGTENKVKAVWFKFSVTCLAPLKNPGLDKPAVIFFWTQDSQITVVLQFLCVSFSFSVLPMWTCSIFAHVFLIIFYNKVKKLCILALMRRMSQTHCCKLL